MKLHCSITTQSLPFTLDSPHPFWTGTDVQTLPTRNGFFSTGPLRLRVAQVMDSSGIPPIPLSAQKWCDENYLPPTHYMPKNPLFTFLHDKQPLFTHTCQNWLLRINPNRPQIICFIIFSTEKLHAHTCEHQSFQPTSNFTLKMP